MPVMDIILSFHITTYKEMKMQKSAKGSEEKKKPKRPTEKKRNEQNKKRRLINKSRLSAIRSQVRNFLQLGSKNSPETLNEIYSLVDKASKLGLFKENKAGRIKSRLARKLHANQ